MIHRSLFLYILCSFGASLLAEVGKPPAMKSEDSPRPRILKQKVKKKRRNRKPAQKKSPPPAKTQTTPQTDESGRTLGEGLSIMGRDIKIFGEQVISRIDRLVKKKTFSLFGDPWTIQGVPLAFPNRSAGFHVGFRVMLDNVRRQDPHKIEIEGQVLASNQSRFKHFIKLDIPRLFDDKFRFTSRLAYDRDITLRYFGRGNDVEVDQEVVNERPPEFDNVRESPNITFEFLRRIGKHVRIGPIAGLKFMKVSTDAGSRLDRDRPLGFNGGRTHYLGLAIVYDTLDFEPYPSKGSWHELFLYWYSPLWGSDYKFFRTTYTYRRYFHLRKNLIFAHRTLFESLTGDVPFYELDTVGGSHSSLGFLGDRFIRGINENQFVDKIKFVMGFELRWDPLRFELAKQDIAIGFVPFFDFGRVWPEIFPIDLSGMRASIGWGIRTIWNHRFVIRADFAYTVQGTHVYVDFGSNF